MRSGVLKAFEELETQTRRIEIGVSLIEGDSVANLAHGILAQIRRICSNVLTLRASPLESGDDGRPVRMHGRQCERVRRDRVGIRLGIVRPSVRLTLRCPHGSMAVSTVAGVWKLGSFDS